MTDELLKTVGLAEADLQTSTAELTKIEALGRPRSGRAADFE